MSGFRPRFFIICEEPAAFSGPPTQLEVDLTGRELALSPEDSHHALHVLRSAPGDECEVVVGAAVYAATMSVDRHRVRVRLGARLEGPAAGAHYAVEVGLVQALSRPAVVDQVLEKATEVGASFFILVQTAGSPRRQGRTADERLPRWRRIVLEAAKQSKQTVVPEVLMAGSVDEVLTMLATSNTLSLQLQPSVVTGIWERCGPTSGQAARVALWVGPESGWTPDESDRLARAGVEAVRMGRSVLRAETAGPVAVAVTRLLLRDW